MGLTDAMISADVDAIFDDLAATGATETVSRIAAGETEVERTFGIVRTRQLTAEELQSTGFSKEYRFSVYAKRSDLGPTTEGDVIVMADGDRLRVYRRTEQPARIVERLELGDEFEDGERFDHA